MLDVAAAHKRVKLQEADGGLQFFQVGGRLYRYRVCHFGARWSAYWWARVGALLHRLAHQVVYVEHFGFLYVDDWLFLVNRDVAPWCARVLLCLLQVVGCPLSWKKVRVGPVVDYLGFVVDCGTRSIRVPGAKLERVLAFLAIVLAGGKAKRKVLEKGVGLLIWVTFVAKALRPWLSAFYAAHNRASVAMKLVDASQTACCFGPRSSCQRVVPICRCADRMEA